MDWRQQLADWRAQLVASDSVRKLAQRVGELRKQSKLAWRGALFAGWTQARTRTADAAKALRQQFATQSARLAYRPRAHWDGRVRPQIGRVAETCRAWALRLEALPMTHRVKAWSARAARRMAESPLAPWARRLVERFGLPRRPVAEGRYRIEVATPHSRRLAAAGIGLLALLIALPAFAGRDLVNDLIFVFTMLALAQYWNLLAGYAGLVSVGQQAFVGLGGYLLFALTLHAALDPLLAILLAGLVTGALALPTALVVFRLRGAYFAIGTWVMAEVYRLVIAQFKQLGGGTGTSLPPFVTNEVAGIQWVKAVFDVRTSAARDIVTYWAALALATGTILLVYLILRSRHGLALAAIRDTERAAESVGVDTFKARLWVYVVTATATGMVGALIYLQKARISPDAAFAVLDWTAYVIFIVVIGGIATIEGPIVGVLVLYVLQTNLAHFGTWYLILLGLFAILVMLFAPRGIWGYLSERYGLVVFPIRRRLVISRPPPVQA